MALKSGCDRPTGRWKCRRDTCHGCRPVKATAKPLTLTNPKIAGMTQETELWLIRVRHLCHRENPRWRGRHIPMGRGKYMRGSSRWRVRGKEIKRIMRMSGWPVQSCKRKCIWTYGGHSGPGSGGGSNRSRTSSGSRIRGRVMVGSRGKVGKDGARIDGRTRPTAGLQRTTRGIGTMWVSKRTSRCNYNYRGCGHQYSDREDGSHSINPWWRVFRSAVPDVIIMHY